MSRTEEWRVTCVVVCTRSLQLHARGSGVRTTVFLIAREKVARTGRKKILIVLSRVFASAPAPALMGRGTGGGGASRKSPGRSLHERIAEKAPEALQDFVQTRLTTSPPIVLSTDLFATGYQPAHVALDEPLCPPANQSDDCTDSQGDLATIACLCAQMHLLVEKEAHLAQDPDGLQSELMDTVNQGLERLYSQLQRECMALHPDLQLHESMHVSGMSQMFPVVTERLQLQADPPAKNQVTTRQRPSPAAPSP